MELFKKELRVITGRRLKRSQLKALGTTDQSWVPVSEKYRTKTSELCFKLSCECLKDTLFKIRNN